MKTCMWLLVLAVAGILGCRAGDDAPIKVGVIGLDTSHAIAFTDILNDPKATGDLAGFKVVVAFPGGSPDIKSSIDRVPEYTEKMKAKGVEIVDSIEKLLEKCDVVLLESVDGRPHLSQATPVLKAKKPVFIDKPVGGTLRDAVEIYRLAAENNTPVFSSSALRYCTDIGTFRGGEDKRVGEVVGCVAWSPCGLEPHHPDLYWYGIHGVETLFTIMGPGCVSVSRTHTPDADVVTGVWKDGRTGTFRGTRKGSHGYGAVVFGSKGTVNSGSFDSYKGLVAQIGKFFKTKTAPVTAEETIEIYAFMEAADESKRQSGAPVTLENVLAKARAK